MDNSAIDIADVPLLFAVNYLIREYKKCITALQRMLDENESRHVHVPLPHDHPVAMGVPLPHSLLAPHRQFCEAVRVAIAAIESLWKAWKRGPMILKERSEMSFGKPEEYWQVAVNPTDVVLLVEDDAFCFVLWSFIMMV